MAEVRGAQHARDADVVTEIRQAHEDRSDEQDDAAVQDLGVSGVLRTKACKELAPRYWRGGAGSNTIVSGFKFMLPARLRLIFL